MNSIIVLISVLLQIPMADQFRADGKIYVVIAVILIILTGIFLYLIRMDKSLRKIEKRLENKK